MNDDFAPGRIIVDFGDLSQCPICYCCTYPPVLACRSGKHVICPSCVQKVNGHRCPVCRLPMASNSAIDCKLKEVSVAFPCRNVDACPELLTPGEMAGHLSACEFRPYDCNLRENGVECSSILENGNALIDHWASVHGLKYLSPARVKAGTATSTVEESFLWKEEGFGSILKGFKVHDVSLVLRLVDHMDGFCVYVMATGVHKRQCNIKYKIKVYFGPGNRKVATFADLTVVPIRGHDLEVVLQESEVALIHWTLLNRLYPQKTDRNDPAKSEIKFEIVFDLKCM